LFDILWAFNLLQFLQSWLKNTVYFYSCLLKLVKHGVELWVVLVYHLADELGLHVFCEVSDVG